MSQTPSGWQNTWYSIGEVSALLQAVVNRPDWTATSAAAFVLKGTTGTWGRKFAYSVDGSPAQAPRLVVTYVPAAPPPPPDPPPSAPNRVQQQQGAGRFQ